MKQLTFALLLSMLAAPSTLLAVPPGQSNLLANGSFELWSMSSENWAKHTPSFGGKQRILPVRWNTTAALDQSQDARSGKFAAVVSPGNAQLTLGNLECNPGSTYSFGVYAKGSGKVIVRVNGQAMEGMQQIAETSDTVTDQWKRIGGEFKMPSHMRLVNLTVIVHNGKEKMLIDDAYIACDPGFAYDADACLFQKPKADEHTILLADFETDKGLKFVGMGNKSRIIDDGKFGRGLRMEKSDLAVINFDNEKLPPEGTVEAWIKVENNAQHLALSGNGQRVFSLGGNYAWGFAVPNSKHGSSVGWHNHHLIDQVDRATEFMHTAFTWGPDGVRCYSNGTLVEMSTTLPSLHIVPNALEIGAIWSHQTWAGVVDEVRISSVRRYGILAPKGDKMVPVPQPAAQVQAKDEAEAVAKPAAFDEKEFHKSIATFTTPLPTTEGKFETSLNDKGQYIYEASSIKPLITHSKIEQSNEALKRGNISLATIPGSRESSSGEPDIHGAYWKLGDIKPGRYWVSLISAETPAIYFNGRIVQALRMGDPLHLWPGMWMTELFVDEPIDLKSGDEIALQAYWGPLPVARLILHTNKPTIGHRPAPLQLGGSDRNLYTSHALSTHVRWYDKDVKPLPPRGNYWSTEQSATTPEQIQRGPDGRPVVRVLVCNTLPVAVKAQFDCTVHSYYRIKVGSHRETLTLQPHESVERLIAFDPIDDEPSYSAKATIKAIDRPALNWPEGDQVTIFEGSRQSVGWADPFEHELLRRLVFTQPIKSVRQVLLLSGQGVWERAYTPDFKLVPAPADLKWERANVPMNWFFNHMNTMKPRMHSMYLRRKFTLPPEAAGRTVNLVIEAVQDAADAWINGQYVGQILGGNVPMVADATKAIKIGENEIILLVRDLLPLMNPAYVNPTNPECNASYLDIPGFFGGNGVGINDVFLETSPIIAANELQALPSLRNKKIITRFELINHRSQAAKVRVKSHILAEGKSELVIDDRELTLEPHKPLPMSFEKPWDNARIWGPEDPFLYVLAVEVFDSATGERVDLSRARFGFRDCWIDGPSIMLNGTAIRPIGAPIPRGRKVPIMTRGPRGIPDYWDEMGYTGFKFCTQLTNSSSRHNLERDAFWENAQKNAIKHIRRYINHPCIIAWDLSNEWLQYLGHYSPNPMLGPNRYKALSDALKAYDPTRWTTANAESDWGGLNDNHNFHYMKPWFIGEAEMGHRTFYPNAEWWRPLDKHFEPNFEVPLSPHERHDILRPHKKVIMDGEYLWKVGETMPPALAEVCDEDDVLGWAVDSASGPAFWHWMNKVEGHRDLGVAPIHTYSHPGVEFRAFQPRIFLMPQLNHNALSGTKFIRLYTMMNDTMHLADVELKWRLLAPDGKVVLQGKDVVPGMKTGYNHRGQIEVQLPQVTSRTRYSLDVRMYADGEFCFGRQLDVDVWPTQPTPVGSLARNVVLFDPAGNSGKVLDRMGIKYTKLNALTEPLPQPASTLLLVGEEALDESSIPATLKILDFVKAGGRALFLQQVVAPMGLPAPAKVDKAQWSSICFNRMPLHPIVQGLTNWDLSFWGVNHVAAKGCYSKPEQGSFLTIIDAGYYRGLEYVDLMEQYVGQGIYLLCQMHVIAKYDEEPMARELLARMIRYAGNNDTFLKPTGTLQAAIETGGETANRLDDVGAEYKVTQLAGKIDPSAPLLIEATQARQAPEADRAKLAQFVQAGGTAVITCPTPDDAAWLTALAGTEVKLTPQMFLNWRGRAMRLGHSPLTAGLSHIELYWKRYDQAESAGNQADVHTLTIEPIQDYSVHAQGARELIWPGTMLELKVSKGTLIIDQRRWTTSAGDLAINAFRNVSALMLGLNVKMAPAMPQRILPKEITFRTIDITQFCNRSLADEKSDDGIGGWSDQGAGTDLKAFTTGKLNLQGIPFVVGDHPRSCMVLANRNRPGHDKMPRDINIPVGYATQGFYFLHSFAYSGGNTMGVYQIVYADGTTFDIPLKGGINARDWVGASNTFAREKDTSSSVAWTGSCERFSIIAVYKMLWVNPRPEVQVKAIRFFKDDDMGGVPILMGLTSVLKREQKVLTPEQQQQVRQLIAESDKAIKAKDLPAAEKSLRQAIEINPKAWEAYQKLADILEQKATEDQRLEFYYMWVEHGAEIPLPYNRIAEILEKRKDLRSALEFYTRSLVVEWNQPPVIETKKRLEAELSK